MHGTPRVQPAAPRRATRPASEPDADSIEDTARALGVGRSFVYRAIHPDPAVRDGLPFLPSIKAGKRRLVRVEARRAWLAELEERCVADAQTGAAP